MKHALKTALLLCIVGFQTTPLYSAVAGVGAKRRPKNTSERLTDIIRNSYLRYGIKLGRASDSAAAAESSGEYIGAGVLDYAADKAAFLRSAEAEYEISKENEQGDFDDTERQDIMRMVRDKNYDTLGRFLTPENINKRLSLKMGTATLLAFICMLPSRDEKLFMLLVSEGAALNVIFEGKINSWTRQEIIAISPLALVLLRDDTPLELADFLLERGSFTHFLCKSNKGYFSLIRSLDEKELGLEKKEYIAKYLKNPYRSEQGRVLLRKCLVESYESGEPLKFLLSRRAFRYSDVRTILDQAKGQDIPQVFIKILERYTQLHDTLEERIPAHRDLAALTLEYVGDGMFTESKNVGSCVIL